MAKILSIASTEILKTTRQLILENAGHEVVSFVSMPLKDELEVIGKPDLAMVGHGFRGPDKRKTALALNQMFPGIPILELCMHSPEIPGADFILSHSPEHLVTAVREVLAGRRVRGFPA
ncbi:MAG TPA: hypothetical protein VJV96_14090 [Candidatus Angelobacter sp.]|jgi:hypothetical protein|nr:hypothetical protein [Candidatus Angelobacter sp.]